MASLFFFPSLSPPSFSLLPRLVLCSLCHYFTKCTEEKPRCARAREPALSSAVTHTSRYSKLFIIHHRALRFSRSETRAIRVYDGNVRDNHHHTKYQWPTKACSINSSRPFLASFTHRHYYSCFVTNSSISFFFLVVSLSLSYRRLLSYCFACTYRLHIQGT